MKQHPMHKPERQLSPADTMALLKKGHHAVLSVNGEEGYPYAVPVNYVVVDDTVYIHSAPYGYKIECLEKDPKCCLSVIVSAQILPEKMTAKYESVVAFGTITMVQDREEKVKALTGFVTQLGAGHEAVGYKMIETTPDKTAILRLQVDAITGKAYLG